MGSRILKLFLDNPAIEEWIPRVVSMHYPVHCRMPTSPFLHSLIATSKSWSQGQPQQAETLGTQLYVWEFPKIRGTIVGVPIIRKVVLGDLY